MCFLPNAVWSQRSVTNMKRIAFVPKLMQKKQGEKLTSSGITQNYVLQHLSCCGNRSPCIWCLNQHYLFLFSMNTENRNPWWKSIGERIRTMISLLWRVICSPSILPVMQKQSANQSLTISNDTQVFFVDLLVFSVFLADFSFSN